ncbi:MAG: hypothetical protein HC769_15425 [Cyanobacteria bacterium CRU_2_1]|nr:hypothetical protein [Cyanobacteria bacterium RU_5_0]NJR60103.1 hypothetical protein [Cyanobacteria bacterium CRU_2_1]
MIQAQPGVVPLYSDGITQLCGGNSVCRLMSVQVALLHLSENLSRSQITLDPPLTHFSQGRADLLEEGK